MTKYTSIDQVQPTDVNDCEWSDELIDNLFDLNAFRHDITQTSNHTFTGHSSLTSGEKQSHSSLSKAAASIIPNMVIALAEWERSVLKQLQSHQQTSITIVQKTYEQTGTILKMIVTYLRPENNREVRGKIRAELTKRKFKQKDDRWGKMFELDREYHDRMMREKDYLWKRANNYVYNPFIDDHTQYIKQQTKSAFSINHSDMLKELYQSSIDRYLKLDDKDDK